MGFDDDCEAGALQEELECGVASSMQLELASYRSSGEYGGYNWRRPDAQSFEDEFVEGTHYSLSTVTEEGSQSVDVTGEHMLAWSVHVNHVTNDAHVTCMYFIPTHFFSLLHPHPHSSQS